MRQYIIKRLLLMIPTLLGVAVLIFLLMRVVPGDLVELKHAGEGSAVSAETLQKERELLWLDKPLWHQFGAWVWDIIRGDFGVSMWTGRPVLYEISIRFQLSLQLAVMATFLAVLLAIPLGTMAALKQDTWVDYAIRVFSIAGLATPSFWLGIIVILGLLILFGWLPPMEFSPFWENPVSNIAQLIWPTLAIGYRYSAMIMRMTRSSVLEVLREDYIRTARAKGLRERLILVRHALKNAMLPVISVIGLEMAFLIGGMVVTEQVFNLNGLGRLLVQSIEQRDYTMTQSLVLLTAVFFIVMNFVTDLLFAWLDPRVRYK
ncbi:MAG: ABC transporter permease [Deltaproteobacteria bacterium]|nr:ABC transporter permease [Deltaproteobacteria bacterium]